MRIPTRVPGLAVAAGRRARATPAPSEGLETPEVTTPISSPGAATAGFGDAVLESSAPRPRRGGPRDIRDEEIHGPRAGCPSSARDPSLLLRGQRRASHEIPSVQLHHPAQARLQSSVLLVQVVAVERVAHLQPQGVAGAQAGRLDIDFARPLRPRARPVRRPSPARRARIRLRRCTRCS